jgi:VIT1/CCC1 family predicted Fe2+/Mn2+ transporter
MIPLIPFIFVYLYGSHVSISNALLYSIVATASSFFLIENIRSKVVHKSIIASGFNTVLIGGAAAAVAYCIGYVLSTIIH